MVKVIESAFAKERASQLNVVGTPMGRTDLRGHVTGRTQFYEDRHFPEMLHLKIVRSPHHHARITGVHLEEARKVEGVVRILTHEDVPGNVYTVLRLIDMLPNEERVLAEDVVLYRGDPIVAVVAETPLAAALAASKVRIDLEELPAVLSLDEALAPGAPVIKPEIGANVYDYGGRDHFHIHLGDVDTAFGEADHVLEHVYESSPIEHAPVETNGCIAVPGGDGRLTVYTNTQAMFFTLNNLALMLDVPTARLRLIGGTVGGGFGGKVDVMVEPLAALAAMLTGRPVKFRYSREEEMQVSSPRAAERIRIKDGVMRDGRIVARETEIWIDCGAYSRHTTYGTIKAATHMPGPYTIPNVRIASRCVYTNRTPSSAMRGFGVTISDFALESQMDRIAALLGRDPVEIRLQNAYRDGDIKAHRKAVLDAALIEVIQAAAAEVGHELAPDYLALSSSAREAGS
jgi:CO/xanthine dehydrogenase Mo-binding subunit